MEDIYKDVLIKPSNMGFNELNIISGYATAAMSFRHLNELNSNGSPVNINLIVGMVPRDGLTRSNHVAFKKLVTDDYRGIFSCSYLRKLPAVHSKVYVWCLDKKPVIAFTGSANYTQTAFNSRKQKEYIVQCDPVSTSGCSQ